MKRTLVALTLSLLGTAALAQAGPSLKNPPGAVGLAVAGGMTLETSFPAPGGMTGWLLTQGVDTPVIVYTTADGSVALAGNMLDSTGKNLTREHLDKYTPKPDYSKLWSELEKSTWVAEGATGGAVKSTIYVFEDANCSFCHLAWKALRHYQKAGLQVRWIPVAFLSATSFDKAAQVLSAPNPSAEFTQRQERHGSPATVTATPAMRDKVNANNRLMQQWGFKGTPAIIYKDASGKVMTSGGMPSLSQLPRITGLPEQRVSEPELQRFR